MSKIEFARSRVAAVVMLALFTTLVAGKTSAQSLDEIPASTELDQSNRGVVKGIAFAEKPQVLWNYTGKEKCWFGGFAVYDGIVAAIERNSKRVIGLSAESGDKIWEQDLGDVFSYGFGIIMTCDASFDAVIVGCDSGLFALDRKTGERIWEYEASHGVDGPTIASGFVIAGGSDGAVHAVDLKTGEPKWTHDYLADAPEDPKGFDGKQGRFEGRPARPQEASTDGETVFLSIFDQCRTLAVDAKTGERRWGFQTKGWTGSRPTITNDAVYIASQDKHFYAINKQTGKEIWKVKTGKWNSASPAITERLVVVGSNDGKVYAILREMGSPVWEFDTTDGGKVRGSMYSRPLVSGNTIYQPTMGGGTIHAIDLNSGEEIWRLKPLANSEFSGDPHFDDGRMFVQTRASSDKDGEESGQAAIIAIGKK